MEGHPLSNSKHTGACCPGPADMPPRPVCVGLWSPHHRDRVGSEQNQTVLVWLNKLWSPRVVAPKGLNLL